MKSKEELDALIEQIKAETPVGIDTQYTHAVIIDCLQQILERLDVLEEKIKA